LLARVFVLLPLLRLENGLENTLTNTIK